ncbi:MAG: glycosyltransferase [Gammaproteobacteria bacterium]|nr:glycosyltransferase [Gammaproteobacteria bacterium]
MSKSAIVIGHVVLSLKPGGLENGVVNVINRLDKSCFRSVVFCLQTPGEFAQRIEDPDVKISAFGLTGGNDISLVWRLANALKRAKVNVVHTRNPEAFFYGALAARLACISGLIHSEHGRNFPDKWHRMWLQRVLSKRANAIFAMSEDLKSKLVANVRIPENHISVVYNGVDEEFFAIGASTSVKSAMGLSVDHLVVGSVGRLVDVKNQAMLIESVARLQRQGHKLSLILVGDGPLRNILEAQARLTLDQGSYKFCGFQNDVRLYLQAMDIFALTSRNEGISNTLLEAMAARRAVIATRVGGNVEIIKDRVNGLLVENEDVTGFSAALLAYVENDELRDRLADAGQSHVRKKHSMAAMISQYESLYRQAVNEIRDGE